MMGRQFNRGGLMAVTLSVAIHAVGMSVGWWGLRQALMAPDGDLSVSGITVTLVEMRASAPLLVEAARLSDERLLVREAGLGLKDFLADTLKASSDAEVPPSRVSDVVVPLSDAPEARASDEARKWADVPSIVPDVPAPLGGSEWTLPLEVVPVSAGEPGGGRDVPDPVGDAGLTFSADVHPRYPAGARARGAEGAVTVSVEVGDSGRVVAATVTQSSAHGDLDQAALDAVRRARFVSKRNGKPSGGKAVLTFRFQLTE